VIADWHDELCIVTASNPEPRASDCRLEDTEHAWAWPLTAGWKTPSMHEPGHCKGCQEQLPAACFHVDPRRLGGRKGLCLACQAERSRSLGTREVTIPEEKKCCSCQETLPAARFMRISHSRDGLSWSCRQCQSKWPQKKNRLVTVPVVSEKCASCGLALPAAAFNACAR